MLAPFWLVVLLAPSPSLSGRVVDQAGLLTTEQEANLVQELERLERDSSVQIVIATLPSLDGRPLEDVARGLAETWALGQRGLDNGALVLVARDERQVRIEVGYGLEGAIPDALASRIIQERIAPRFRERDYAGGLLEAVRSLGLAARSEYPSAPKQTAPAPPWWMDPERVKSVIGAFLLSALLWFVSFGILWDPFGIKHPLVPAFLTALFTLVFLGIAGWATLAVVSVALPAAFGIGWLLAPFGHHMDRVSRSTRSAGSWSSGGFSSGGLSSRGGGSSVGRSSGGGFSGGGGRFGGGGASGSW